MCKSRLQMKEVLKKSFFGGQRVPELSFVKLFSTVLEQYVKQCLHLFRSCKSTFILSERDISRMY